MGAGLNKTMSITQRRLRRSILYRVLLRSFFVQSAMNYQRMQNVGFAFALQPALAALYRGDAYQKSLTRHLLFFNSNPILSAVILGAVLKLEEQHANGHIDAQSIEEFKQFMMGPVAALGDAFFWTSLKPMRASMAVLGTLLGYTWSPILFLLLYTSVQLFVRIFGVFRGYRRGDEIYLDLQEMSLVRLGSVAQLLVGIFVGASGAVFIRSASRANNALEGPLEVFLFGSLVLIFLLSLRRKLDATGLLYISVLGSWALFAAMNYWFPLT